MIWYIRLSERLCQYIKKNCKRVVITMSIFLVLVYLPSCLFPEKFVAKINMKKDGTYSITYDGILVSMSYIARNVGSGPFFEALISKARQIEGQMLSNPNFKKVENVGNGRYKVLYKDEGKLGSSVDFLNEVVSIKRTGKDRVEIRAMKIEREDSKKLENLNMKIDGELRITTNARVVKHNAKSEPWLWGLIGAYTWEIKSVNDPAPYMVVQLR